MRWRVHFTLCAVAAALWTLSAAAVQAAGDATTASELPESGASDATLTFRGRTATAGVGFVWGDSTLEFEGKVYPVRVDGFVAGAVGTASVEGIGRVYGLKKLEDLDGDFTAVGAGGAFGHGAGRFLMANEKGVRIVMETTGSGLQLGAGPRAIRLSVGKPGDAPVDAGPRMPRTLGFGEAKLGSLFLRPTLNAQVFVSASNNPGFDGTFSAGPLDEADDWIENSAELGMNARYVLGPEGEYGTMKARVSGVYSRTGSGPDGPACNGSEGSTDSLDLEGAYLAWQSGNALPGLGPDALELSFGNQNYQVFDGLLFWDGGQDCTGRGANWLSPRKAFQQAAIATLRLDKFEFEGAHLKFNDEDPDTGTQLGLGRIEYVTDDGWMEHLKLGALFFNIYDSDDTTRNGMKGIYLHSDANPLRVLPNLSYKASFIRESNSRESGLSKAYGWYFAPSYSFPDSRWKPELGYRYAAFSGGGTEAFDPLFAGLPSWGTWFQGELLGEYAISNSNLISHQLRLTLAPSDTLKVNLIYYKFLLDDREQDFGTTPSKVSSSRLADEIDLIFDLTPANWFSVTATVSVAFPNRGFREAVDGEGTWVNAYLYLNLNF
jgi:hypothetical protein